MESIINPLWFYLLEIIGRLQVAMGFGIAICVVWGIVIIVLYYVALDDTNPYIHSFHSPTPDEIKKFEIENDKLNKAFHKKMKKLITITIVFIIITVLIPSKETLITMFIAKVATYDNVDTVIDTIKNAVDYVTQAIATAIP